MTIELHGGRAGPGVAADHRRRAPFGAYQRKTNRELPVIPLISHRDEEGLAGAPDDVVTAATKVVPDAAYAHLAGFDGRETQ
jgi:hypothetical protein